MRVLLFDNDRLYPVATASAKKADGWPRELDLDLDGFAHVFGCDHRFVLSSAREATGLRAWLPPYLAPCVVRNLRSLLRFPEFARPRHGQHTLVVCGHNLGRLFLFLRRLPPWWNLELLCFGAALEKNCKAMAGLQRPFKIGILDRVVPCFVHVRRSALGASEDVVYDPDLMPRRTRKPICPPRTPPPGDALEGRSPAFLPGLSPGSDDNADSALLKRSLDAPKERGHIVSLADVWGHPNTPKTCARM